MLLARQATGLSPPPPPPVNLVPDTRYANIAAGSSTPMIIGLIFILARCYSRTVLIRNWGWDDSLIVLAGLCALLLVSTSLATLTRGQITLGTRGIIFMQGLLYQLCVAITKLSILCSYLRIVPRGTYRTVTWITIGFLACFTTSIVVVNVIVCDRKTGKSFHNDSITCIPLAPILRASTPFHCAIDAWLIVLIVPFIASLSIPKRQKTALSIILSLGVLVMIASIIRVIMVTDRLNYFAFAIWTSVELNTGLICASAAATLPLWRKIAPRLMSKIMGGDSEAHRGVSTQLSRIRARDHVLQLASAEVSAEFKSRSEGSQTTKSTTTHSSSGTSLAAQPGHNATSESGREPRQGRWDNPSPRVDEDRAMLVAEHAGREINVVNENDCVALGRRDDTSPADSSTPTSLRWYENRDSRELGSRLSHDRGDDIGRAA